MLAGRRLIGIGQQLIQQFLALGFGNIESDVFFVSAVVLPPRVDAVLGKTEIAQRVAFLGVFDMQHLGPKVGQQSTAQGGSYDGGTFNHLQALECRLHSLIPIFSMTSLYIFNSRTTLF